MVYDGRRHVSAWELPVLRERAWIVSSFGKTYHVTGWKVGYVLAPAALDGRIAQGAPVQRVHRQHPLCKWAWPGSWPILRPHEGLSAFYQAKRDRGGRLARPAGRGAALRGHILP